MEHTDLENDIPSATVESGTAADAGETSSDKKILLWLVTLIMVLAIAGLLLSLKLRKKPEPQLPQVILTNVEVWRIVPEEYRETLQLPAVMEADRQAAASFEIPGILAKWHAAEGAAVQAGEVLAELNTDLLQAEVEENAARLAAAVESINQAEIATRQAEIAARQAAETVVTAELGRDAAQAALELTTLETQRARILVQEKAVPQSAADTAENAFKQAEIALAAAANAVAQAKTAQAGAAANIEQTAAALAVAKVRVREQEQALATAKLQLDKAVLKAPFAGVLDQHLLKPGEVLAPGQAVAMIYDLTFLRAAVDVPDRFVPFLNMDNPALKKFLLQAAPGARQELRVKVELPGLPKLTGGKQPGLLLDAELVRVAQAADPLSNTFRAELRLPNPGMALKQGIVARAHVDYLIYPAAVVLPVSAVQVSDAGPRVLILREEQGRYFAVTRDIEPNSIKGNSVLVTRGVQADELLVIAGGRSVLDGEEVNLVALDGKLISGTE